MLLSDSTLVNTRHFEELGTNMNATITNVNLFSTESLQASKVNFQSVVTQVYFSHLPIILLYSKE